MRRQLGGAIAMNAFVWRMDAPPGLWHQGYLLDQS